MNKKLFKLFLSMFLLSVISCSNKVTSSEKENTSIPITKEQILNVLKSFSQFNVNGEIWDFSAITELSKLYNYKEDIYNSVQLTSSAAGSASVNELISKLKAEVAPKLDEIGIYFLEDVTTLWGDPDSTRPLHLWFRVSVKDGYTADKEIEQLFSNELMIIFITQNKWK
ncbi:hypothetical protein [Brachyspira pilosicoli]|uniref:hypothetical protein n=1 Tax=Brachyspira pilosicoli TaxID=52584 RepID=UPI003007666F